MRVSKLRGLCGAALITLAGQPTSAQQPSAPAELTTSPSTPGHLSRTKTKHRGRAIPASSSTAAETDEAINRQPESLEILLASTFVPASRIVPRPAVSNDRGSARRKPARSVSRVAAHARDRDVLDDSPDVPDFGKDVRLLLLGTVEVPSRDIRFCILTINDRVVYGREGDLVAGRYRLVSFSSDAAEVVDRKGAVTHVAPPPPPPPMPDPPPQPSMLDLPPPALTDPPLTPDADPAAETSAPAADESQQGKTGNLRFAVTPTTAAVYVDGYFVGAVEDLDAGGLNLEVGTHRIELRAPDYESIFVNVKIGAHGVATYRAALQPRSIVRDN